MTKVYLFNLESRDPDGKTQLISRGESRESGLAAFAHYLRADGASERRYSPTGGHRLVLLPTGRAIATPATAAALPDWIAEAEALGDPDRFARAVEQLAAMLPGVVLV